MPDIFKGYKGAFLSGLLLAVFWCLITGAGMSLHGTSHDYRYEAEFASVLYSYPELKELYNQEHSFPVPGLEGTFLNEGICKQMVPQGICRAEDYILISAYDSGTGEEEKYHSVIYVLSAVNHKLLTVLELPDETHAGGLAFDGIYVWVAKGKEKACSVISYDVITLAVNSGKICYGLNNYTATVPCGIRASFLTYFQEQLWIGICTENSREGNLCRFAITTDREGNLELVQTAQLKIPEHANGVVFSEIDGRVCMAVNCSWSRYLSSKVYLYEAEQQGNGLVFQQHGYKTFPPMLEEAYGDGEYIYFLFESAATCYSSLFYHKCAMPVDRVCALGIKKLFDWM